MTKIVFLALSVCATILITSCETVQWDWEADPYEASYKYKSLMNADAIEIRFDSPGIDNFTCFTSENIAELKFNIERLKIPRKEKSIILAHFNTFCNKQKSIRIKDDANYNH